MTTGNNTSCHFPCKPGIFSYQPLYKPPGNQVISKHCQIFPHNIHNSVLPACVTHVSSHQPLLACHIMFYLLFLSVPLRTVMTDFVGFAHYEFGHVTPLSTFLFMASRITYFHFQVSTLSNQLSNSFTSKIPDFTAFRSSLWLPFQFSA